MAARGNVGDRCRHSGFQLVTLAAILFAAFAFAQPAAAQDGSGGGEPPASTDTGTSDTTESADAPTAEEAGTAPEAEPTESTEPAESSAPAESAPEPPGSEGTQAKDEPTSSNEPPADPPDDAVKMEEEAPPADANPADQDATPADQGASTPDSGQAAGTGCGTSTSADADADTQADSASSDAACGDVQTTSPSAPTEPREQSSPPTPTASSPSTPQTAPAAAPEESAPSIVLVVAVPPEAQQEVSAAESAPEPQASVSVVAQPEAAVTPSAAVEEDLGTGGVSLGAPDPLIGLALARDSPVRARLIAVGGKAAVEKLVSCARPGARVPLSRTCTRLRAEVVFGLRAGLWPSHRTSPTALTEVGRVAARAQGRRAARATKSERNAPTIERAKPSNYQSNGPWASGGSTGGSSTGSGTLRIFALTAAAVLPFVRPRALRTRMRASLVPVGELGVSLPERPG